MLQKQEWRRQYLDPIGWRAGIELLLGTTDSVANVLDESRRPLGERGARLSEFPDLELTGPVCAFAGSRAGKKINQSAMRQVASVWDEVLETLNFVAYHTMTLSKNDGVSVADLDLIGGIATGWSAYLHRRGQPVSNLAAALYKTGQGLNTVCRVIAHDVDEEDCPLDRPLTLDEVYDLCEAAKLFVKGDHACAGPPKLIHRFFEVALNPKPSSQVPRELSQNWDKVFRYSQLTTLAYNTFISLGMAAEECFLRTSHKLACEGSSLFAVHNDGETRESEIEDLAYMCRRQQQRCNLQAAAYAIPPLGLETEKFISNVTPLLSSVLQQPRLQSHSHILEEGLTEELARVYQTCNELGQLADLLAGEIDAPYDLEWTSKDLMLHPSVHKIAHQLDIYPIVHRDGTVSFSAGTTGVLFRDDKEGWLGTSTLGECGVAPSNRTAESS